MLVAYTLLFSRSHLRSNGSPLLLLPTAHYAYLPVKRCQNLNVCFILQIYITIYAALETAVSQGKKKKKKKKKTTQGLKNWSYSHMCMCVSFRNFLLALLSNMRWALVLNFHCSVFGLDVTWILRSLSLLQADLLTPVAQADFSLWVYNWHLFSSQR